MQNVAHGTGGIRANSPSDNVVPNLLGCHEEPIIFSSGSWNLKTNIVQLGKVPFSILLFIYENCTLQCLWCWWGRGVNQTAVASSTPGRVLARPAKVMGGDRSLYKALPASASFRTLLEVQPFPSSLYLGLHIWLLLVALGARKKIFFMSTYFLVLVVVNFFCLSWCVLQSWLV